jgi:hypothetical protein
MVSEPKQKTLGTYKMRYLITFIAFFTPSRANVAPIAIVDTNLADVDAVYVPADYSGPVVAIPVDEVVFTEAK